jgi:micrococcal nuclease
MKKKVIILLFILFLIGIGYIYVNETQSTLKFSNDFTGKCTYVVDGDTIDVEGIGRIRFAGVNTPEKGEKGYAEAKNFTKDNLLNKTVVLDIDKLAWKGKYGEGKDRYNRTLAKILTNNMKTDFCQLIVDKGYAEVDYFSPSEFSKIEKKDSFKEFIDFIFHTNNT